MDQIDRCIKSMFIQVGILHIDMNILLKQTKNQNDFGRKYRSFFFVIVEGEKFLSQTARLNCNI